MLKRTFKTAQELDLHPRFFDKLVELYWLLENREIPNSFFNMSTIGCPDRDVKGKWCGTPGCYIGHLRAMLSECELMSDAKWSIGAYIDHGMMPFNVGKVIYVIPPALHKLFYPQGLIPHFLRKEGKPEREYQAHDIHYWGWLSLPQAALALRRYLETGTDGWVEAFETLPLNQPISGFDMAWVDEGLDGVIGT